MTAAAVLRPQAPSARRLPAASSNAPFGALYNCVAVAAHANGRPPRKSLGSVRARFRPGARRNPRGSTTGARRAWAPAFSRFKGCVNATCGPPLMLWPRTRRQACAFKGARAVCHPTSRAVFLRTAPHQIGRLDQRPNAACFFSPASRRATDALFLFCTAPSAPFSPPRRAAPPARCAAGAQSKMRVQASQSRVAACCAVCNQRGQVETARRLVPSLL